MPQGHDRDATFDKIHDGKLKIPSEPKVSRVRRRALAALPSPPLRALPCFHCGSTCVAQQAKKLIRELLRKDRNKRLCGAGQIRRHKWFAPVEWARA